MKSDCSTSMNYLYRLNNTPTPYTSFFSLKLNIEMLFVRVWACIEKELPWSDTCSNGQHLTLSVLENMIPHMALQFDISTKLHYKFSIVKLMSSDLISSGCGMHLWFITNLLCNVAPATAGSQSLCRLFNKAEPLTLMTVDFFLQSDALLIISSKALCSICTQRTELAF